MKASAKPLERARFFGVWTLERWELWRDGELFAYPHGETGTGQIIYASQGVMSATMQSAAWPSAGDGGAPLGESYISYAGRWRVEGDQVHHDVAFASVSSWVGRRFSRMARFDRKRLYLETPPATDRKGRELINQLIWRRGAEL